MSLAKYIYRHAMLLVKSGVSESKMSNCLFIGKYNYGKCYFINLRCMHDLIENHKICDDYPKYGQNKRTMDTEQFSSS